MGLRRQNSRKYKFLQKLSILKNEQELRDCMAYNYKKIILRYLRSPLQFLLDQNQKISAVRF